MASTHERAVNLLFDDGPLVALLPAGAPLHPWAVELTAAPGELARVGEGEAVHVGSGALTLGPLRVSLDGMTVAELRLRSRPSTLDPGAVRALAGLSPAPDAASPFASALAVALASFRACGDPAVLAVLVGVGEGLTPSGDDVIVGALAALDAAREAVPAAAAARERLGAALAGCATRTTRLSSQMIAAALDGRYAEPVIGVLEALAGDAPHAQRERAAAALVAVGHRSGADTLRGIVAALERAAALPAAPAPGDPRASAAPRW